MPTTEVEHGPTRGTRKIDRLMTNFPRSIVESDTLLPLDDGQGRVSDHRISYFKSALQVPVEKTVKYKYRHYTDDGARCFQSWIAEHSFIEVYREQDVNEQLSAFLNTMEKKWTSSFPSKPLLGGRETLRGLIPMSGL